MWQVMLCGVIFVLILAVVHAQDPTITGGGSCSTATDCQLAGECSSGTCQCDPGWTGPHCSLLDLAPIGTEEPAAWNSEHSPRSSWGADVLKGPDGKYHGFFNQLPGQCGLSSWLPGSNIAYGVADTPLGPFTGVPLKPPPGGVRNPLDQYATNPHIAYDQGEATWLLFFNGRKWAPNDLTNCQPNQTGLPYWHGGGTCNSDKDCAGFGAKTDHSQSPGKCIAGACQCEHHSFGFPL